jgi:hypothetical protein
MNVQPLDSPFASQTLALLGELRLSLFGIHSRRLHAALIHDGLSHDIDCRIAVESDQVLGIVLAAPASYWRSTPLKHWGVAVECLRARLAANSPGAAARPTGQPAMRETIAALCRETPPRTWKAPGDAWRIILIGSAAAARGRGVATRLYRSVMTDRSLVARIALDNTPSIRLHRSLGWQLYPDGQVALAVHLRDDHAMSDGIAAGCRRAP